ncbi:hypothetical protein SRB5_50210 [Streptomyces sp. RB5]|uniref:DUF4307 domain-containing protein n=1 Tax=Streptomyces smaragdinus TaxID=2585196 RepID=A0A7K0CMY7_9ACTN|nr:DUF4307 domain-containing protein [Streptomyces smaragdinus]MQY14845.1 hypothetical protein [Streptomyces smaragdinus]
MTAAEVRPPEGRYGRAAADDARSDRRLKLVGAVLGVLGLGVVGWFGYDYVAGTDVSGQLVTFRVQSDTKAVATLEVHKDSQVTGVCTVRAVAEDKSVVGSREIRIEPGKSAESVTVDVRTLSRATSVELLGCQSAG